MKAPEKLHTGCINLRPPELRWQSGRLLTARSSVRSRVEALFFSIMNIYKKNGVRWNANLSKKS